MDDRQDPPRNLWPRSAALASTLPALIACSDRQVETGFRMTGVAFDNDSTITLTFSQPVGNLEAVDPNDFRLSVGQTLHATYTYDGMTQIYDYTSYRDLSSVIYDYYSYGTQFTFMLIEPGAAANQIVLRTTNPLGPAACDWLAYAREDKPRCTPHSRVSRRPSISTCFCTTPPVTPRLRAMPVSRLRTSVAIGSSPMMTIMSARLSASPC